MGVRNGSGSGAVPRAEAYDEDTFRYLLAQEEKRSQRSGCPLLLLLLDLNGHAPSSGTDDLRGLDDLFGALRQSLRETDVIGWYRADLVVGAVLTQPGSPNSREEACRVVRERDSRSKWCLSTTDIVEGSSPPAPVQPRKSKNWNRLVAVRSWTPHLDQSASHERRRPGALPSLVVNQALFRDVLARERSRADRSNEPIALLVVTTNGASIDPSSWDAVVSAVDAVKRESDLLGWIQPQAMLGVILTELRATNYGVADLIERRIRRELEPRLDQATAETLSVRLHVHPNPAAGASGLVVSQLHPLLDDICLRAGQAPVYDTAKRAVDIVGSVTLLTLLSPLLLLISAAIKHRSRGPVLFKQVRIGREARPFTMLKFRTMRVNAHHGIHQAYVTDFINDRATVRKPTPTQLFKISDDPRVTRLGRLLRKTSMDEIPQLWNVLRGDMSLVGPRPPLPYEVEQYKAWHRRRVLEAMPGITGLWQVTGRSRTTFDEMVRLDLRYAQTRSLWTDFKILLATPGAVIAGTGAS